MYIFDQLTDPSLISSDINKRHFTNNQIVKLYIYFGDIIQSDLEETCCSRCSERVVAGWIR